jgi:hypothetical protein
MNIQVPEVGKFLDQWREYHLLLYAVRFNMADDVNTATMHMQMYM